MRVDELLLRGAAGMTPRSGLPDPRREASWLLAAAMGWTEVEVRVRPEASVPPEIERTFLSWVERRQAGEPAEHLVGRCLFWGRSFAVSPAVLIPRPETELLIEAALELRLPEGARALDVGTGSGCIASTLAIERPEWEVWAVDLSHAALAVARGNGGRLGAPVHWVGGDLLSPFGSSFDVITANLPYIPTPWMADLPIEVRADPRLALDGGEDGLDVIRTVLDGLGQVLNPGGWCLFEVAEDQAADVEDLAAARGLDPVSRRRDIGGCDRIVVIRAGGIGACDRVSTKNLVTSNGSAL